MRKFLCFFHGWIRNLLHPLNSKLAIIDNFSFVDKKSRVHRLAKLNRTNVGVYSYIGPRTRVNNVNIGAYCSISWDCDIGLESHAIRTVSTSPIFTEVHNGTGSTWISENKHPSRAEALNKTVLENDVWVGARAMIISGVRVGNGAVIGAGAIVTKDVPPYAIVAGVPAKIIGYRFAEEIIVKLLETGWWDYSPEEIQKNIDLFLISNPTLEDIIEFSRKKM